MIVCLFLLFSILGRFGVALLGFAYNIEETLDVTAPLFRPDWKNLTISRRTNSSLGNVMHDEWDSRSIDPSQVQRPLEDYNVLYWLFNVAQAVNGPPWLTMNGLGPDFSGYPPSVEQVQQSLNLSMFSGNNHAINVTGDRVIHTYQFQDLRGTNVSEYAQWDLLIETKCQRFKVLSKNLVNFTDPVDEGKTVTILTGPIEYEDNGRKVALPYVSSNFSKIPMMEHNSRWIQTSTVYYLSVPDADGVPVEPWQYTVNSIWFISYRWPDLEEEGYFEPFRSEFAPAEPLLFNCTILLDEVSTAQTYRHPWPDSEDEYSDGETPSILNSMLRSYLSAPFTTQHTISYILDVVPETVHIGNDTYSLELSEKPYLDVYMPGVFNYAIGRKNTSVSEIWLAAYMGNYIANILNLIGDILKPIEIQGANYYVQTKLLVKWGRVVSVLSGLATFQLLMSLVAILYCRGNFEITDDVSTLSLMLGIFPLGQASIQQQKGTEYVGTFVAVNANTTGKEDAKLQWVFKKKQE